MVLSPLRFHTRTQSSRWGRYKAFPPSLFILPVCVYGGMGVHVPQHVSGSQRTLGSRFSPSTKCVSRREFGAITFLCASLVLSLWAKVRPLSPWPFKGLFTLHLVPAAPPWPLFAAQGGATGVKPFDPNLSMPPLPLPQALRPSTSSAHLRLRPHHNPPHTPRCEVCWGKVLAHGPLRACPTLTSCSPRAPPSEAGRT